VSARRCVRSGRATNELPILRWRELVCEPGSPRHEVWARRRPRCAGRSRGEAECAAPPDWHGAQDGSTARTAAAGARNYGMGKPTCRFPQQLESALAFTPAAIVRLAFRAPMYAGFSQHSVIRQFFRNESLKKQQWPVAVEPVRSQAVCTGRGPGPAVSRGAQ
jgi:hypothetical protein